MKDLMDEMAPQIKAQVKFVFTDAENEAALNQKWLLDFTPKWIFLFFFSLSRLDADRPPSCC